MSGKERGGRIRRGRQHLPRNSLTTTSPPSVFSAPPPFDSTSPARRHESTTYSCPPAWQEYIAPPPFPHLAVPVTVKASILATSSDDVFGPPATATTTPTAAPVTPGQDEGKDKAEAKNDESAEEKAATSTPKQSRRKRYKRRPGHSRRKPRRKTPRNARAICGNCKRPKNHMVTLFKPSKKEKEEEKGDGNGNWGNTDSDRESQICECDENEEVKKAHKRNFYVEGETPESSGGTLQMWLSRREHLDGWMNERGWRR